MSKNQHNKILGLVGAGYWGKNHLRVFNQLGVLKTVCDLDKKILKQRKKEYPELKFTTDFSDVLQDKEIKAVVIATPAVTHFKITREVLRMGKDVFVEKPLALKIKEGEELTKLAQKKKLILMVGHILHYHPAVIEIKKIIKKGELGNIRYIWSNRLNFGKVRREEDVLWSFAPHDISIIIDFLGMPKRVNVLGKSYLQNSISDTTLTFLEFGKKKTAHIFGSWLNPFKEQKLVVIGSKKMVVFDDQIENKLVLYPHKIKKNRNRDPEAIKKKGKIISIAKKEPLLKEAEHFLECIKKRKKPETDGKEAMQVLKVLNCSQKSLLRNKNITI